MDFSKLNPDVLRELLKLSELKAALHKQMTALDERLASLISGKPVKSCCSCRPRQAPWPTLREKRRPKAAKAPESSQGQGSKGNQRPPRGPQGSDSRAAGCRRPGRGVG